MMLKNYKAMRRRKLIFLTIFDYLVLNNKCISFSILYENLTQEEETLHVNLSCICRRELVSRKTRQ